MILSRAEGKTAAVISSIRDKKTTGCDFESFQRKTTGCDFEYFHRNTTGYDFECFQRKSISLKKQRGTI